MIAYLKGKVINKTEKSIILEVENIGYEVFLPEKLLFKIKSEEERSFYIYHQQKEDAQELYGFSDLAGREFFKLLISVSGVGPKSALNVMSIAEVKDLKEAIISGNAEMFRKVSGIGKKTAERIIVELKSKFGALSNQEEAGQGSQLDEIFGALSALGFSDDEIRNVYNKIPKDSKTTSEKIKAALKLLRR